MQVRNTHANVRNMIALAAGLTLSALASAQAVDVSASVTEITGMKTAVLSIGAAVFAVAVGVKLYKWIRSAL
ncbi:MAG: methyltransferase [Gammaproteobacteria bacterium]|nr:methyltransferase [Gammaproteobacteria bacterium]